MGKRGRGSDLAPMTRATEIKTPRLPNELRFHYLCIETALGVVTLPDTPSPAEFLKQLPLDPLC